MFIFGYVGAEGISLPPGLFPHPHPHPRPMLKSSHTLTPHSLPRRMDRNLHDPSPGRHPLHLLPDIDRFLGRHDPGPHGARLPHGAHRGIDVGAPLPRHQHRARAPLLARPLLLRLSRGRRAAGRLPRPAIPDGHRAGCAPRPPRLARQQHWVCDCVGGQRRGRLPVCGRGFGAGEGGGFFAAGCFGAFGGDCWVVDVAS